MPFYLCFSFSYRRHNHYGAHYSQSTNIITVGCKCQHRCYINLITKYPATDQNSELIKQSYTNDCFAIYMYMTYSFRQQHRYHISISKLSIICKLYPIFALLSIIYNNNTAINAIEISTMYMSSKTRFL